MPIVHAVVECAVRESFRVRQVMGMFDLPERAGEQCEFAAEIPSMDEPWNIGVIVGPSGSGKTTIARQAFGDRVGREWNWPRDRSLLDGFPRWMTTREITKLLGSVGFSSPPAWLRPFRVLSNGEQFRVNVARTLAEVGSNRPDGDSPSPEGEGRYSALMRSRRRSTPYLAEGGRYSATAEPDAQHISVVDEFTSVVDRTVAKIGSAAIARAVRESGRRLVAVTCHYDVLEWLEPDWVVDMGDSPFPSRRFLRRPRIELEVIRCDASAWRIFERHHYLTGRLHGGAHCFVGLVENRPAVFVAALYFPHPLRPGWREHRCVCLPDFQGVGIGNAMSEFVASLFAATGKPYRSVTGHPGMIHHRAGSDKWRMTRGPSRTNRVEEEGREFGRLNGTSSRSRMTASFEYVGCVRVEEARMFGVVRGSGEMDRKECGAGLGCN
jgi:hypothetical protein